MAKVEKKIVAKDEKKAVVKEERKATRQQPNFFQRALDSIRRYFRESIGELRKVTWPTRKEATNLTIVVLIVTFTMSILLGFLDFIFSRIFALILG